MARSYAISDIHGNNKTFLALLDKIAFTKADSLYLLGDYIDRGPDTKGVIDTLLRLKTEGYQVHCLRGNHEQLFLDAFHDTTDLHIWHANGGFDALKSYQTMSIWAIPQDHVDFIKNLDWYFEVDTFILVHAGLDWREPLNPFGNKEKLIWERNWHSDINYDWLGDRYILHGHTPVTMDDFNTLYHNMAKNRFLDIDLGCFVFKTRHKGYGHLCAFSMTDFIPHFQQNVDYNL